MTRILSSLLIAAALLLAGCGSKPDADAKRYPMQGTIKSIDAVHKTAMIDAGKIGDWMEPMTMEYPIKPDAELQKLHVGDKIEATVVVMDPGYYVTDVKVK